MARAGIQRLVVSARTANTIPTTTPPSSGARMISSGAPMVTTASAELARPAGDTTAGESGADQRAMVLAAEGVTVVLVATGSPAAAGAWESLADVALGTSCAATAHGCH